MTRHLQPSRRRDTSTRSGGSGSDLPPQWRGPIIGPGIDDWASITENDWPQTGSDRAARTRLPAELAWMAHWQAGDGTRVSVLATGAAAPTSCAGRSRERPSVPASIRAMDWDTAAALQGWFYASRGTAARPRRPRPAARRCSASPGSRCSPRCHDGPGGSWTTGTRAATRGSR